MGVGHDLKCNESCKGPAVPSTLAEPLGWELLSTPATGKTEFVLNHTPWQARGRILGRNWESFPPSKSQSYLLMDFTPPPARSKVVWNWFVMYCKHCIWKPQVWELSITPRNLNKIVRSWIRLKHQWRLSWEHKSNSGNMLLLKWLSLPILKSLGFGKPKLCRYFAYLCGALFCGQQA